MQKEFWKPSGNILFSHPQASAILVKEEELFTLTPTLSPQGRGRTRTGFFIGRRIIHPHPDPLPSRERENEDRVFHRDKFYSNFVRQSAPADSESNIRKGQVDPCKRKM